MVVEVHEEARTVALRSQASHVAAVGVVALAVTVLVPAAAERWLPVLLVPALLVAAAAAGGFTLVLGRTVELDDRGITLHAARRRRAPIAWDDVAAVCVTGGAVTVELVGGGRRRGPRCDAAALDEALTAAAALGLTPRGDAGRG